MASNQSGSSTQAPPSVKASAETKEEAPCSRGGSKKNPEVLARATGTLPTESYANTNESRVGGARANHVSSHAGAASSAAESTCSAAKSTRGNLSSVAQDRQVEHITKPVVGSAPTKEQKESRLKAQEKQVPASKNNKKKMCIVEPQEKSSTADTKKKASKSKKMYEIPLTILPGDKPKRKKETKDGQTSGRWTHEEHQAFLEGLKVFGREWKKVAERIPTRTSAQIRSHAQKYFSKLAREEAIMANESASAMASLSEQQQQLPVSVQRTAERILANPIEAQAEVEDTLRQLRERYRQLQIRLEESQRARGLQPMDRIAEDAAAGNDGGGAGYVHRGGYAPGLDRRKRSLEEVNLQHQDDGASSVSSDLSQSLASLSPKREFGNEELIALHVLGGTLPRSASGSDLQEHHRSRSSTFSEAEEESSDAKRQRLDESKEEGQDSDHDQDETVL